MRYMINMDYSADLPINTMGRRIRTRLYFTSESHLHTVLNTLRFGSNLLSEHGIAVLNATPELCYLTQIVLRVFEDNRFEMTDPRRFRVEILFSPGATATPLHLQETDRANDASRYDTASLQMIGREGLTCQEMEDFFDGIICTDATEAPMDASTTAAEIVPLEPSETTAPEPTSPADPVVTERALVVDDAPEPPPPPEVNNEVARKYFWSSVAVTSLTLGLGCLYLAFEMSQQGRHRRRWSSRRY